MNEWVAFATVAVICAVLAALFRLSDGDPPPADGASD